jgi:hypothetical protein
MSTVCLLLGLFRNKKPTTKQLSCRISEQSERLIRDDDLLNTAQNA